MINIKLRKIIDAPTHIKVCLDIKEISDIHVYIDNEEIDYSTDNLDYKIIVIKKGLSHKSVLLSVAYGNEVIYNKIIKLRKIRDGYQTWPNYYLEEKAISAGTDDTKKIKIKTNTKFSHSEISSVAIKMISSN